MTTGRSFRFKRAIVRQPATSVIAGLRAADGPNPSIEQFLHQHSAYITALETAGLDVTVLPPLEIFPDSVFVEDTALCLAGIAIILRPGAPTRLGESAAIRPDLEALVGTVIDLPGAGFVDGGDILVRDDEVLIGLSARTDTKGIDALSGILADLGYNSRLVKTPPTILHFKTECGLLDANTVFSTPQLAASGCFNEYRVIETATGEEAAANAVRINDTVLISAGYPLSAERLRDSGYNVKILETTEAAKVDGGLSCMSLRF